MKFFYFIFFCFLSINFYAQDSLTINQDKASKERKTKVEINRTTISDEEIAKQKTFGGEQPITTTNIEIGHSKLKLWGYCHMGYNHDFSQKKNSSEIELTRVILMAKGDLSKKISFFLMYDAVKSQLHEFYGEYAFNRSFKLRFGQYKQPFMLENIIPPTLLNNIKFDPTVLYMCGIATDPGIGNHVARDLGLMLNGDIYDKNDRAFLNYQIGIFNGTGMLVKENNKKKDVIGMLNYMPNDQLTISGSFIYGYGHAENTRVDSNSDTIYFKGNDYRRHRASLGLEYKGERIYFRTEGAYGIDNKTYLGGVYVDGEIHIIPKKFDFVAGYDYFNKNINTHHHDAVQTAIVGLQYWIYKRTRILSEYVYTHRYGMDNKHEWITQLQICF